MLFLQQSSHQQFQIHNSSSSSNNNNNKDSSSNSHNSQSNSTINNNGGVGGGGGSGGEGMGAKQMKEEEQSNWFSRWEEQLPSPDELTPLTQTLITPDLAVAFDIATTPNPSPPSSAPSHHNHHIPTPPPQSSQPNSSEFVDSADLGSGAASDEPARTLKRPRLVWTPQLHKRFVDAVAHLGIKNAVPKTIMQLMSVDGLTRENVASHLQKYRLYLKRMQNLSAGGPGAACPISAADAVSDHLFASAPVPHHFLHRNPAPAAPAAAAADHYLPFVPVAALQHHHPHAHHHHHQVATAQHQHHFQQQRHIGHFGSPPTAQFDHGFLARQPPPPPPIHRMVGPGMPAPTPPAPGYIDDFDSGASGGGRKVLTLFPTGDD